MNIFGFTNSNAGQSLPSTGGTLTGNLNMGSNSITNADELILVQNSAPDTPPVGALTLYTDNDSLHYKNSSGTVVDLVNSNISTGLQYQVEPLAPAGHRDLWQASAGFVGNGGMLVYDESSNILYSSDWNPAAVGAKYSTDGGVTWASVVFDVAPGKPTIMSFNGSGLWIAMESFGTGNCYISADGINFTQQVAASGSLYSSKIQWLTSAGLFIAGLKTDATHWISTSPNGITWTPRVTPDWPAMGNFLDIACNDDMAVVVGEGSNQLIYSADGITWTLVAIATPAMCVTWSSDRSEFFALNSFFGNGYTSPNGITWTAQGIVAALGEICLIWVGGDIQRYYITAQPTAVYGLASTHDPSVAFVTSNLDGAVTEGMAYSQIAYLAPYNRFVLGIDSTTGIAYSTARPNDLKALSDNIRVRGSPVSIGSYSAYSTTAITNTAVETTLVPATSLGSLAFQALQFVGMSIRLRMVLAVTSTAGDTLTVRIKNQAGTLQTLVFVIGALGTAQPLDIDAIITLRAASVANISTRANVDAAATKVQINTGTWNPAIANTISITGQWGLALSSVTTNTLDLVTNFRNSA